MNISSAHFNLKTQMNNPKSHQEFLGCIEMLLAMATNVTYFQHPTDTFASAAPNEASNDRNLINVVRLTSLEHGSALYSTVVVKTSVSSSVIPSHMW